jgi:hypothetical protein
MTSKMGQTAQPTVRGFLTFSDNAARRSLLLLLGLGSVAGGCATPASRAVRQRDVAAAARPLLEMRPDANWTECYNRLVELGPASVDYLMSRPIMRRTAAPDNLQVMVHVSLLRLLANPATAPRLSVNCFETTLDVLHFNPKVRGRTPGQVRIPTGRMPVAWHDLYPSDFDHLLARQIDVEADRRAMLNWWQARRGEFAAALTQRRLQPRVEHLWPVLSRRYADVWTYEARPTVLLCSWPPGRAALFRGPTYDYNLVRAVCIWLGMSELPTARDTLVELVVHPSEIVAYNARFALRYSRDARIREVLERYKEPGVPPAAAGVHTSAAVIPRQPTASCRMRPARSSCGEQGSAAHEVAQAYIRQCVDHRDGDVHGRAVWRP